MTSSNTNPVEQFNTLARVRKTGDLEAHVRRVEVDGVEVIEIRDYIPSLDEYGRGYWIPADSPTVNQLAQALLIATAVGANNG